MKNFKLIMVLIFSFFLAMKLYSVYAEHDHAKEDHHEEEEHGHKEQGEGEDGHDEHGHEEEPIVLSEESQNLAGIGTIKIEKSSFAAKVSVSGRIAQDVEDVKYVFSPESATVKECKVALGENVEKDALLCTVEALNNQVLEIKSPVSGTVISQFVKRGEHVDQTTSLYAIADLTKLWANFDVYEKDIASIQLNQKILVYPLSYPDKVFEGKVVFISPRVDETTYTLKIRAEVNNENYLLKLGMSIRGEILLEDDGEALAVPTEAIQTVENRAVVFKKTDNGFEPQEVEIQSQTKEMALIGKGLIEGDEIVVKGSFILKSKMLESEMGHDHAH